MGWDIPQWELEVKKWKKINMEKWDTQANIGGTIQCFLHGQFTKYHT